MMFGPETGEGKPFAKLRESFASEAQTLADEVQAIAADRAKIAKADAADPQAMKLAAGIKSRDTALLQKRLAFGRKVLADYLPARNAVRREAQDAAYRGHEDARAKVIAAMVDVGFRDGLDPATGAIGILPDQIARHPLVMLARGRLKTAQNMVHATDDLLALKSEVAALEESLKATAARLAG